MRSSDFIIEKLQELDYNEVLEVGCGVGDLTVPLIIDGAMVDRYITCDNDADSVLKVQEKLYGNYHNFSVHYVDYLKLHSSPKDLVISAHVLEEYIFDNNIEKAIKILDKMCKDSNKYVVHTCDASPFFMEYWMKKQGEFSITGYNIDKIRKVIIAERV